MSQIASSDAPYPPDLFATGLNGIERDATILEIRLALHAYRKAHGKDHWRLLSQTEGRA